MVQNGANGAEISIFLSFYCFITVTPVYLYNGWACKWITK